jgi:hypothetical protein
MTRAYCGRIMPRSTGKTPDRHVASLKEKASARRRWGSELRTGGASRRHAGGKLNQRSPPWHPCLLGWGPRRLSGRRMESCLAGEAAVPSWPFGGSAQGGAWRRSCRTRSFLASFFLGFMPAMNPCPSARPGVASARGSWCGRRERLRPRLGPLARARGGAPERTKKKRSPPALRKAARGIVTRRAETPLRLGERS